MTDVTPLNTTFGAPQPLQANPRIRNIAVIAHVDHGKTTLVDALFRQSGVFRIGQEVAERVMDNLDLERERGITIAAKNCAVFWQDVKINIIDTPGHADFGSEVERALSMADGALLLVDASEGPLPQTRFVLKKALELGLKLITLINKIDRADARPAQVLDQIYDLFIDLGATEAQLDFPVLYTISKTGQAWKEARPADGQAPETSPQGMKLLFDTILAEIPPPTFQAGEPFQMLVTDLSYSDYLGRLAIGRIRNGEIHAQDHLICINGANEQVPLKVTKLQSYQGPRLVDIPSARAGDIVVLSGIEAVRIGDTICHQDYPRALKRIVVDEPTVSMLFTINSSPLSGKEGRWVQSSKIRERLMKETLRNVGITVTETEDREALLVNGRGEFQMAILVETMRREGFELCVGRPRVIMKEQDGRLTEPMEHLLVDCDEMFLGIVNEKLAFRKGRMTNLVNNGTGRVRMEFLIPARTLIGYRDEFLTDTKGTGIMNTYFAGYQDYRGDVPSRFTGSIVSDRQGYAVAYALFNLEPRGRLCITPGEPVYEGLIVGEHNRDHDINVNPCKEKKLTNIRAAGKDDAIVLTPIRPLTLEQAINFIQDDEMVEVTPKSIRLRKTILSAQKRHSARNAQRGRL